MADRVEREHDRILVTRNGRPSFVLVSPTTWRPLEESLDILQDDELMQSLRTSGRQTAAEDTVPLRDQHRNGLVFEVEITREGLRHLKQLPDKVRDAAIQAILGSIAERPPRLDTPWSAS